MNREESKNAWKSQSLGLLECRDSVLSSDSWWLAQSWFKREKCPDWNSHPPPQKKMTVQNQNQTFNLNSQKNKWNHSAYFSLHIFLPITLNSTSEDSEVSIITKRCIWLTRFQIKHFKTHKSTVFYAYKVYKYVSIWKIKMKVVTF